MKIAVLLSAFWIAQAASAALPYELRPRVELAANCAPYKALLEGEIAKAMNRFESCLNFAFVREDLARRMAMAINEYRLPISVRCQEPPRSNWCAAGGYGQVWLSPSKMLEPGSFCHDNIGSFFIHELGHVANLKISPDHNESGDTGRPDEVYSLQNYCMRSARTWTTRAYRTADVVDPAKLECMRDYQELTPSTFQEIFWDAYRDRMTQGYDPCDPAQKALNVKRAEEASRPRPKGRKGS